ncbi:hypothetical protein [Gimesia algae]|uniref:hypothetical protein n=1 Tax=Gimesia algae TaxID=2527971 RepID=UPI0018D703E9|nr:hypothetical protein [Gimesia algae]
MIRKAGELDIDFLNGNRSAYRRGLAFHNYFNNRSGTNVTKWANRLDLFGQLNLSGME